MPDRSRSPQRNGVPAATPQRQFPSSTAPGPNELETVLIGGNRPFTGVRAGAVSNYANASTGGTTSSTSSAREEKQSGPLDPLDAYMASVQRELERSNKGKKKRNSTSVGDVASAREAFGPQALQKLRPGGFEGRDPDNLLEDKEFRR